MKQENPEHGRRVMTAILFSTVFFIIWQAFLVAPPEEEGAELEEEQLAPWESATPSAGEEAAAVPPSPEAEAEAETERVPGAEAQPSLVLRTENFEASFTNTGGRLAALRILSPEKYIPREDMRGIFPEEHELVRPGDHSALPMALRLGGVPGVDAQTVYHLDEEAMAAEEGVIAFRHVSSDGRFEILRTWRPDEREFGLLMEIEIRNLGEEAARIDGLHVDTFGEFDGTSGGFLNPAASVVEAICASSSRVERTHGRKVSDPEVYTPGPIAFVGANERYFMNAVAPRNLPPEVSAERCSFERVGEWQVRASLHTDGFHLQAGESASFGFTVYLGPKGQNYLEPFGHHLEKAIDLGWMSFLAVPIRWLLLFLQGFVINWGLAIILLTVIIKSAMLPLTAKAFRSMEKMREISPKVAALKEKYESDPTKLAEEQMKLFRESGVNPLGGCLPMLLQMPIYFALYQTIWGSAELYNAEFILWIDDLSRRDPIYVLPVLMGSVMFIQQKMMPTTVDNPQIRVMQTVMPIMFTVFMLWLPSGLVLYIFVNMVLSIGHQLWIRRNLASAKEEDANGVAGSDAKVKDSAGPAKARKRSKKKKS